MKKEIVDFIKDVKTYCENSRTCSACPMHKEQTCRLRNIGLLLTVKPSLINIEEVKSLL